MPHKILSALSSEKFSLLDIVSVLLIVDNRSYILSALGGVLLLTSFILNSNKSEG